MYIFHLECDKYQLLEKCQIHTISTIHVLYGKSTYYRVTPGSQVYLFGFDIPGNVSGVAMAGRLYGSQVGTLSESANSKRSRTAQQPRKRRRCANTLERPWPLWISTGTETASTTSWLGLPCTRGRAKWTKAESTFTGATVLYVCTPMLIGDGPSRKSWASQVRGSFRTT